MELSTGTAVGALVSWNVDTDGRVFPANGGAAAEQYPQLEVDRRGGEWPVREGSTPQGAGRGVGGGLVLLVGGGAGTRCSGLFGCGGGEKPPIQAKVSRWVRPKFRDWPPPIDRPARARWSRSVAARSGA